MSKLVTRTVKLEIRIDEDDKEALNEKWSVLRDLNHKAFKYQNDVYRFLQADWTYKKEIKGAGYDEKLVLKELYGKTAPNFLHSNLGLKEKYGLPSYVSAAILNTTQKHFSSDIKEILQGRRSGRNYKLNSPIPFMVSAVSGLTDEGFLFIKKLGIRFAFVYGKDKSGNRQNVQRVIDGEYKFCDSSIQLKGKKAFLLMVIQHPRQDYALDKSKVVGVDLGINNPAYVALNNGLQRSAIGYRRELIRYRTQADARKRSLQKRLSMANGGRGRAKKLKALDRVRSIESNFAKTYNHMISKKIIQFALRNNAGTIRLEDLKGFGDDEKNQFVLRNWGYFQLQTMIKQKAHQFNIDVEMVNPRHTSQCCSNCGHIDSESRDKKDKTKFTCTSCGESINADYNGAVNIARGGIYPLETESSKRKLSKSKKAGGNSRAVSRPNAEGCGHSVTLVHNDAGQLSFNL